MRGRWRWALAAVAALAGPACGGARAERPPAPTPASAASGPSAAAGLAPSALAPPAPGPSAAAPAGGAPPAATKPGDGARAEGEGEGEGEGAASPAPAGAADERWCAPEFDPLAGEVCAFVPPREMAGPRTLVIFLHGVVAPGSGWQWGQQRAAARAAKAQGFAVLMPRARRGAGPKGMRDAWAWPGGASVEVEAEIVATWQKARAELEGREARPFERVWVFGFSSGAYYAASLALRGRLAGPGPLRVDGFAAFAGGGGKSSAIERLARRAKARTPVFVGWGGKDRSRDDPARLAALLRRVGWPAKGELSPKAGHAMTDAHVAAAVRFLGSQPAAPPGRGRVTKKLRTRAHGPACSRGEMAQRGRPDEGPRWPNPRRLVGALATPARWQLLCNRRTPWCKAPSLG